MTNPPAADKPVPTLTLPDPSLVLLIAPAGAGKSTFARRHFKPTEILSSDFFRGLVCDDEANQAASRDAFEVLHLPGHSPGSIGLWEKASGTLFSGDALYDGPLLDELERSNVADYIRTMERLLELPVTVVHGGHEPSFGRERLRELCLAYLEQRRPVAAQ